MYIRRLSLRHTLSHVDSTQRVQSTQIWGRYRVSTLGMVIVVWVIYLTLTCLVLKLLRGAIL